MSDDAEVARLMKTINGGDARGPISPRGQGTQTSAISPRGHTTDLEENLDGLSKEEARLLRSMHTTTGKPATHPAPAKKWADPVASKPVPPPENVHHEADQLQPAAPVTSHQPPAPEPHRHARPNHPEEEALVEVVADPEAVRQKEEEQAAKEAARLERLLAKKFVA